MLAVSERAQRELALTNRYLLLAQENLRRVADRDPLTALDNRRTLPGVFQDVRPEGASVLFFDLDGFKQINDLYGHAVGDAASSGSPMPSANRFGPATPSCATAATSSWWSRRGWSGRRRWRASTCFASGSTQEPEPRVGFSCGMAELAAGGSPDAALQAADRAMYELKKRT